MTRFTEYGDYDALGLAELVRKGDITASDLLGEAIARAAEVNPKINAIIEPLHDYARNAIAEGLPEGPFSGVPFLVKDLLISLEGAPQRNGSRFFKDYVATADSTLAKRYKNSGVVIFGKTNTPEFGVTPITDPELFGSTLNPWNLEHSPSGSSGGSAAAVAARIVPMASGGDGGGSIRTPSSCCGLVGLKPTKGRTPTGPREGDLWYGMAVEHVLTRSVRDSAAMLDATHGQDAGPPNIAPAPERPYLEEVNRDPGKLRIAFSTHPMIGRELHPDCKAAVEKSANMLADLGHHVEEATPEIDREAFIRAFAVLVAADTSALIREGEQLLGRKARRQDFEPRTWALKRLGETYTAADFSEAYWHLQRVGRTMGQFMQNYDVLLTSTCGTPPPKPGELSPQGLDRISVELLNRLPIQKVATQPKLVVQVAERVYDFMSQTPVANATGQPSMSLPLHWNEAGLPIGTLFTGKFGDEATLFRLAGQLEQAHPWQDKQPTL